eukprot:1177706-Prorocentrum_minimum.AAC.2
MSSRRQSSLRKSSSTRGLFYERRRRLVYPIPLLGTRYIPIEGLRLVGGCGIFLLRGCDWSADAVYLGVRDSPEH